MLSTAARHVKLIQAQEMKYAASRSEDAGAQRGVQIVAM